MFKKNEKIEKVLEHLNYFNRTIDGTQNVCTF